MSVPRGMRVALVLWCGLLACGRGSLPTAQSPRMPAPAERAPQASASASTVPSADGAIDAEPAGAVPIPDEREIASDPSINERDPTVTFDELPGLGARWPEHARVTYRGRMLVALHVANHERLDLSVVETEPRESGYPGTLESFALGATDTNGQPRGGNAFPPRDRSGQRKGASPAPIRFAVRVLPRTGAPETERRQVVVYVVDRVILVAEKLVTASRWTPRLRIDALGVTDVVAIQPGWH